MSRASIEKNLLRGLFIFLLVFLLAPPPAGAQGRGPSLTGPQGALAHAIAVQEQHTDRLMGVVDVVGTAVGLASDGEPVIKVYTRIAGVPGIPASLDGVAVEVEVTGEFLALNHQGSHSGGRGGNRGPSTTDMWPRPVPIGISTGNEGSCSAGTIGAKVTTATEVHALSNNHVYALENAAPLGSKVLQPGLYDSNCSLDPNAVIGTLADYEPINFNCVCSFFACSCDPSLDNRIDAAIALSSDADLGDATPSNGYGLPKSATVPPALNMDVQKYGRTTRLTKGRVSGVNATIVVGYGSGYARFVDQIVVESKKPFIKAGDSGSLLVTNPGRNPVGLLFAGSSDGKMGIANPIGDVLTRFGAAISGE